MTRTQFFVKFVAIALERPAFAEPCEVVGGCTGEICYMHVPANQVSAAILFDSPRIPLVETTVNLVQQAALLDDFDFAREHAFPRTQSNLKNAVQADRVLQGGGSQLRRGATAEVLGYQTFSQFGGMPGEKFARVLVLTD